MIFALAMLALHATAQSAETPQHVAVRLIDCGECAKTLPAMTLWDKNNDVEVTASISGRYADGFSLALTPGYYRLILATQSCHGDQFVSVLPGHDRDLDVTMNCIRNSGSWYIGRISDGMQGLAGALPPTVRSVALRPAGGRDPAAVGTISGGEYYFDEAYCRDCILDLMLADGRRSRIGVSFSEAKYFSLLQLDLTEAAVEAGVYPAGPWAGR